MVLVLLLEKFWRRFVLFFILMSRDRIVLEVLVLQGHVPGQ